jgi:hypothetical protein
MVLERERVATKGFMESILDEKLVGFTDGEHASTRTAISQLHFLSQSISTETSVKALCRVNDRSLTISPRRFKSPRINATHTSCCRGYETSSQMSSICNSSGPCQTAAI